MNPIELGEWRHILTLLDDWTPIPARALPVRVFATDLTQMELMAYRMTANSLGLDPIHPTQRSYISQLIRNLVRRLQPVYYNLLKILTFRNDAIAAACLKEFISVVIEFNYAPLQLLLVPLTWFEDFMTNVMNDAGITTDKKQTMLHEIMRKIVLSTDYTNYMFKTVLTRAGVNFPLIFGGPFAVAAPATVGIDLATINGVRVPAGLNVPVEITNLQAAVTAAVVAAEAAAAAAGGVGVPGWYPGDAAWVSALHAALVPLVTPVHELYFPYLYVFRRYSTFSLPAGPAFPTTFLKMCKAAIQHGISICCGKDRLTPLQTAPLLPPPAESSLVYTRLRSLITLFRNETELVAPIINGMIDVEREIADHPNLFGGPGPLTIPAVIPVVWDPAVGFPAWGNAGLRAPHAIALLLEAAPPRSLVKLVDPGLAALPNLVLTALEDPIKKSLSRDSFTFYFITNPTFAPTIPYIGAFVQSITAYIAGINSRSPTTDGDFQNIILNAPTSYLDVIGLPNATLLIKLCTEVPDTVAAVPPLIQTTPLADFITALAPKNLDRYGTDAAGHTLMQILNDLRKYTAAAALWNYAGSTATEAEDPPPVVPAVMVPMAKFYRSGLWFTPKYVLSDTDFYEKINDREFQIAFFAELTIVNPAARSGVSSIPLPVRARGILGRGPLGRTVFPQFAAIAAPADHPAIITAAIDALNQLPDYRPATDEKTYDLLAIRDQLQSVRVPAEWDAQQIMLLIATKAAVIHDAITYGDYSLLKVGLDAGADPNIRDGVTGKTPLHIIAGFPVANQIATRRTPRPVLLMKDIINNYKKNTVTRPDFNLKDTAGNTPLHLILHQAAPSSVMMELIMTIPKLNFNEKNGAGKTPLMEFFDTALAALPSNYNFEPIKKVIENSDIDILTGSKKPLFELAIRAAAARIPPATPPRISDKQLADIIKLLVDEEDYPAALAVEQTLPLPAVVPPVAHALPLTIKALNLSSRSPVNLPSWLPAWVKEVLDSPDMPDQIVSEYEKYIAAVDTFIATAVPAPTANTFDSIKQFMAGDWMSWLRKTPLTRTWLGMVATSKEEPFPVQFDDDPATSISIQNPYDARYRTYTVYQPAGDPTHVPVPIPGTPLTPAELDAAKRNNDVLRKFVGKEMITPTTQPFLRKVLESLYYATWNPSLGNDVMTALPDLLIKLESLYRFHQTHIQDKVAKNIKRKNIDIIGFLSAVINRRMPNDAPSPMAHPFPRILFTGAIGTAAAAVAGGIIPVIPGLAAGRLLPPVVPGLAARRMVPLAPLTPLRGMPGRGLVSNVQNLFTGSPISTAMLTATYPTVITLDTSHIITYMPVAPVPLPPPPPVINYPPVPTTANGQEVRGNDPLYLFLQPMGLTAVFKKKYYILRPAEIFIVLFQLTPGAIDAALRDRRNPFVSLLRDYCVPAAIGYATAKVGGANVPALQRILTALQLI